MIPNNAALRAAILEEARSWLCTPYKSHARIKGVGVDCAQLAAAIYEAVGLVPHIAPDYSAQAMMHRDEEIYLDCVTPYAREIGRAEIGPGDFAIWRFGRTYSHGAIMIDTETVIHAVISAGAVVLADLNRDVDLVRRPVRFFSLFEAD